MIVLHTASANGARATAACAALAPRASRAVVVVQIEPELGHRFGQVEVAEIERTLERTEEAAAMTLRALRGAGIEVDLHLMSRGDLPRLAELVAAHHVDLLIVEDDPTRPITAGTEWALEASHALACPVVLLPAAPPPRPPRRLLCPFDGDASSLAGVAALIGTRCGAEVSITLGALGAIDPRLDGGLDALRLTLGLRASLQVSVMEVPLVGGEASIDALLSSIDAMIVPSDAPRSVGGVLAARRIRRLVERSPVPVLIAQKADRPERGTTLEVADAIVVEGRAVLRLDEATAFGKPQAARDGRVSLITGGGVRATLEARGGRASLGPPWTAQQSIGLGRADDLGPGDDGAVHALEVTAVLVGAQGKRMLLADARLPSATLRQAASLLGDEARDLVLVRLDPSDSLDDLRRRESGESFLVVDARDLLDEEEMDDIPRDVDGVRLWRCAARLRAHGLRVDAILPAAPGHLRPSGFAVLDAASLEASILGAASHFVEPTRDGPELDRRLRFAACAPLVQGNALELQIDNAEARRCVLDLLGTAAERIHLQAYIVTDDELGRTVEEALVAAAGRGVRVRVLADSLYSLHRSLGLTNALLQRLEAVAGVEVIASSPLPNVPGLADLKRRDHRKLLVVDGRRAVVTGRNLGRSYYRGFDEVSLTTASTSDEVPWVDASIRVEGPAVAEIEASFHAAWTASGGGDFPRRAPPPAGELAARVVVHEGLGDACTLEAYLACFAAAERTIDIVHAFPLELEIIAALRRAMARGVRVRVVLGRVRPTYGERRSFEGGAIRELANALVQGRLEGLLAAGAEGYEVSLMLPAWQRELGAVHPHVHAKLVLVDDRVCAVGSANLDLTGNYWEAEILVVVDDPRFGASAAREIAALITRSRRIDTRSASWLQGAGLRAFLSRHWPTLLA